MCTFNIICFVRYDLVQVCKIVITLNKYICQHIKILGPVMMIRSGSIRIHCFEINLGVKVIST